MEKKHKQPAHIRADLWKILDICGAAFIIFTFMVMYQYLYKSENVCKLYADGFVITGIVFIILLCLLISRQSSSKIKNQTGKRIYCKDEDSDEVFEVPDGGTAYDIDGFFIEGESRVHKLTDGVHITVKGEDNFSYSSLSGMLANKTRDKISSTEAGWQPLFDKTKKEAPK